MLLTKTVKMNWHPSNINWYKSKGYNYTKLKDEFEVKVEDLPDGSNKLVQVKCDNPDCKKPYLKPMSWNAYLRFLKDNHTYYCNKCANKLYGNENARKTRLEKVKSVFETHPHFEKYFKNKENAKKYSYGSNKEVIMKCPNCNYEKPMKINRLVSDGFSCPKCGDGVSYPEKLMFNVLEQLRVTFKHHKRFNWSKNKEYDFYFEIANKSYIIETHGIQHYKSIFYWMPKRERALSNEQENDRLKESLAKENGIENYLIIDCRKSELDFIKNNILNSKFAEIFDLSNIDWLKCHEFACNSSMVKIVCDIWNNNTNDTKKIADMTGFNRSTVIKYLKIGNMINMCEYDAYKQKESHKWTSIICINTKEIFNKLNDASKKYNIDKANISKCCQNKHISAGKHSETGEPLRWMYYDDYILNSDIHMIEYKKVKIKVICINTNEVYDSISDASKKNNINDTSIGLACKGKRKSAGKNSITREPLKWMYYDEYIKQQQLHNENDDLKVAN